MYLPKHFAERRIELLHGSGRCKAVLLAGWMADGAV